MNVSGLSAYDTMQAYSAQRQSSYESFQSSNATLTSALSGTSSSTDTLSAMLNGGSSSSSSTFVSNDALSSALFGGIADQLTNEENLMAKVISTRYANQYYDQMMKQQDQLASLTSTLGNLSA